MMQTKYILTFPRKQNFSIVFTINQTPPIHTWTEKTVEALLKKLKLIKQWVMSNWLVRS